MLRVAVLVGGGGSNLQALIDTPIEGCEIVSVISHVAGAGALERAARAGIPDLCIAHADFTQRSAFDAAIGAALAAARADIVCLAGFMRLLGAELVAAWQGRMLNIHPSLLPSFKGLHTHRRALAAGVAVHGCTVHQVTAELDAGPILVQGVVPVLAGDDEAALAARVLAMEHRCYPAGLRMLVAQMQTGARPRGGRLLLDPILARGSADQFET